MKNYKITYRHLFSLLLSLRLCRVHIYGKSWCYLTIRSSHCPKYVILECVLWSVVCLKIDVWKLQQWLSDGINWSPGGHQRDSVTDEDLSGVDASSLGEMARTFHSFTSWLRLNEINAKPWSVQEEEECRWVLCHSYGSALAAGRQLHALDSPSGSERSECT